MVKMIDSVITFDKQLIKEILYCFDKSIDDEGFVVDANKSRIVALDGGTIKADEIGGIIRINGAPTIFRNTLPALIEVKDIMDKKIPDGRGCGVLK